MPTVDLPCYNLTLSPYGDRGLTDTDALASPDTSSYGWVNWASGSQLRTVGGSAGSSFDLFTLPDGATVDSVTWATLAYRAAGGDHPAPDPTSAYSSQTYPVMTIDYEGAPNSSALGYIVEPLQLGSYGWTETPIPESQYQYIFTGWPGQEPGFTGIGCDIGVGPGDLDAQDIRIYIAYLAIRINYTAGAPPARHLPPCRLHPRDDGLGPLGGPRRLTGSRSHQGGNRLSGGYL